MKLVWCDVKGADLQLLFPAFFLTVLVQTIFFLFLLFFNFFYSQFGWNVFGLVGCKRCQRATVFPIIFIFSIFGSNCFLWLFTFNLSFLLGWNEIGLVCGKRCWSARLPPGTIDGLFYHLEAHHPLHCAKPHFHLVDFLKLLIIFCYFSFSKLNIHYDQ